MREEERRWHKKYSLLTLGLISHGIVRICHGGFGFEIESTFALHVILLSASHKIVFASLLSLL